MLDSLDVVSTRVQSPEDLRNLDGVILPGVGAFGHAAEALDRTGWRRPLVDAAAEGIPILGICLVMEARRYQHLHHSKWRVYLLELGFFAEHLHPSEDRRAIPDWRRLLAADLKLHRLGVTRQPLQQHGGHQRAAERRNFRDDRGPVDARQHLQYEFCRRHQRTGIAAGHGGMGLAVAQELMLRLGHRIQQVFDLTDAYPAIHHDQLVFCTLIELVLISQSC